MPVELWTYEILKYIKQEQKRVNKFQKETVFKMYIAETSVFSPTYLLLQPRSQTKNAVGETECTAQRDHGQMPSPKSMTGDVFETADTYSSEQANILSHIELLGVVFVLHIEDKTSLTF